ncbi:MAG: phospho-N-acetylmuramoyl-pentapeptide-transferase, partial [Spirochaetales bacterium]|nr:phospho-N-acetylmuramoyl-pentapeptide-transferase [Spirochaetales bacterium]
MLKEIFLPFVDKFTFLNIFEYITFRAAYAAVTALLISFIFGPKLIRALKKRKAGQEIRDDGPQTHLVKSGTPTMGGILILLAVIISVFLWQDLGSYHTWLSLISLVGFGAIGFFDDYLKVFRKSSAGLQAKFKFSAQVVISLVIVLIIYFKDTGSATLLYLPFFKYPVLDLSVMYIPFAVILLVGFSNAVNLTD